MEKLIIWGASGHALVVADIVKLCRVYDLIGYVDDVNVVEPDATFNGLPLFGGKDLLEQLDRNGVRYISWGFGHCQSKLRLAEWARLHGFAIATTIHPRAIIAADTEIGEGTVVAAGAIINSKTVLGHHSIINTGATIDHECQIGQAANICPGVHLAGKVTVGQEAWVGIGSTVKDCVTIGARAFIGAGSVVLSNIPDDMLAYGVPAKIIKRV